MAAIVKKTGTPSTCKPSQWGLSEGVVYSLEYWPVVHDVAGSIPASLMDGEWKTVSA